MPERVEVSGFAELAGGLRKIPSAAKVKTVANLAKLARTIAREAASRTVRRSGRAAASVHGGADAEGAVVESQLAYYGWLDFGGTLAAVGGRRNTQRREFASQGRYILPTVKAHEDELTRAAERAVNDAEREAGI